MTQRKASAFLLPKRTGLRTALKHPVWMQLSDGLHTARLGSWMSRSGDG